MRSLLRFPLLVLVCVGGLTGTAAGQPTAPVAAGSAARIVTPWGTVDPPTGALGRAVFHVTAPPASGRFGVPAGFPHVVAAGVEAAGRTTDLPVEIAADGSLVEVLCGTCGPGTLAIETLEASTQFDDGRIGLSALDATVTGSRARLESHPGNHRIGFWTDPTDSVAWTFPATRWGRYEVRLTYANAGPAGAGVEVEVGDKRVAARLDSTGSWYRYVTLSAGTVAVERAGPLPVRVRCTAPVGDAFMNLKAVCLLPACEGAIPVQAADGTVLLHARDATVRGTMLRWEPAEKKQTLGYWTRPGDAAEWTFSVTRPGTFSVQLLQGCGTGQGGSTMVIEVDPGTPTAAEMEFTVEETGGFQEFRQREPGRVTITTPGPHLLRVQPRAIARQAACDIRQIRLVPVGP